jgi:hypothetical protein
MIGQGREKGKARIMSSDFKNQGGQGANPGHRQGNYLGKCESSHQGGNQSQGQINNKPKRKGQYQSFMTRFRANPSAFTCLYCGERAHLVSSCKFAAFDIGKQYCSMGPRNEIMDCHGKVINKFITGGMRREVYRIKGLPEAAMVWDNVPDLPQREYSPRRGG